MKFIKASLAAIGFSAAFSLFFGLICYFCGGSFWESAGFSMLFTLGTILVTGLLIALTMWVINLFDNDDLI